MLKNLAITTAAGAMCLGILAPTPVISGVLQLRPSGDAEPAIELVRRGCVWRPNYQGKMKCFPIYSGRGYYQAYPNYGGYGGGPCRWAPNYEGKMKCFPIY